MTSHPTSLCAALLVLAGCQGIEPNGPDHPGLRPTAAATPGVTWSAGLTSEVAAPLHTVGARGTVARTVGSVRADLDLDALARVPRTTITVDGRSASATAESESPNLHGLSGNEAPQSQQIAEALVQHEAQDSSWSLRAGLLDANSDIAALDGASNYFLASAGTSPTLLGMPSWPSTTLGIEGFWQPQSWITLRAGGYDTRHAATLSASHGAALALPRGTFTIAELGIQGDEGRLGIGQWHLDAPLETFAGETVSSSRGNYVLGEQRLGRLGRSDDGRGAYGFALVGHADPDVSEVAWHAMLGVTVRGPFSRRDADEVGVVISHLDLSDRAGAGFSRDETAAEAYYRLALSATSTMQLGAQYLRHAGGRADAGDEFGLALRVELAF